MMTKKKGEKMTMMMVKKTEEKKQFHGIQRGGD